MKILSLYAALLAIVYVALTVRTAKLRHQLKISVGDGSNKMLLRAIRAHANFSEYVPVCLILILLVEMQGAAKWVVHVLAASLLIGRIVHAYGVSRMRENLAFRVVGMVLTITALLWSAAYLIWVAL